MIAINLSKQQVLDSDPRAIQQTNFTANLDRDTRFYFILEEAKKNCFGLFTRDCKSFMSAILLNIKYSLLLINIKMTQYNSLNVNVSISQLNEFKSAIKKWNWSSFKIIIQYDRR